MEHHVDRMECPDEVTADTGTQVPFSHGVNNRNSTKAGGDQLGAGLRSASYTNNTLNQITGRGVPSAVDVIGVATAAATVSVNGSTGGVYRLGDYFRRELSATNTSGPQWLPVGVTATSGPTNTVWPTGYVLVPPAGQTFQYDADGNLTNDSAWSYTWDAENRLVQMTNTTAVTTTARKKLVFQYDHQARRIRKTVYPWGATDYSTTPALDLKFLYDDWNLLAELNATNSALIRSCMWGLDLSGSEQGAGGVGGLLRLTYFGASTTNAFVAYDGNGNVVGLVDANGGTNVAEYIYGPFAEPLVVTGPLGKLNPFRFSTKYTDEETDLLYYGYRYYSVSAGRWLSREPLGDDSFLTSYSESRSRTERWRLLRQALQPTYGFVQNNPIAGKDILGLRFDCPCSQAQNPLGSHLNI
jgi:RHS repeat-associated protein